MLSGVVTFPTKYSAKYADYVHVKGKIINITGDRCHSLLPLFPNKGRKSREVLTGTVVVGRL